MEYAERLRHAIARFENSTSERPACGELSRGRLDAVIAELEPLCTHAADEPLESGTPFMFEGVPFRAGVAICDDSVRLENARFRLMLLCEKGDGWQFEALQALRQISPDAWSRICAQAQIAERAEWA